MAATLLEEAGESTWIALNMLNELGVAYRRIARNKGSTLAIVFLIAIALGASSCVFSVWYALLYKPLPYPAQQRLVALTSHSAKMGIDLGWSVPYLDYIAKQTQRLEAVAGYRVADVAIADEQGKYTGTVSAISAEPKLFGFLGARAAMGRLLGDNDAKEGSAPSAVISWGLWRNKFGASPSALQKSIRIGKSRYRIVGVLPEGFWFPKKDVQVWLPLVFSDSERAVGHAGSFGSVQAVGLVKSGEQLSAASHEMAELVLSELTLRTIAEQIGLELSAQPIRNLWVGQRETTLNSMLLAVLMVFAVATANVCSLFMLRLVKRRQETALLEAFGASPMYRARQNAYEIALLVGIGTVIGLALQPIGLSLLRHFDALPSGAPQSIGFDWPTLGVAVAMAALITAAMSVSSLFLARQNVYEVLRQTSNGQTPSHRTHKVRQGLVIGQVAITMVLLFGTALLVRSSYKLLNQDLGFDPVNQLVGTVRPFDEASADDLWRQRSALSAWMSKASTMQGVKAIALSTSSPFGEVVDVESFHPGVSVSARSSGTSAYISYVTPQYFTALGLPLESGRTFNGREAATDAPVAVIDEDLARTFFGASNPLGKTISVSDGAGVLTDTTVVGIVSSARQRTLLNRDNYPTIYRPSSMPYNVHGIPVDGAEVIVRGVFPSRLIAPLQHQLELLAPSLRFTQLVTMEDRIADTISDRLRLNYLLEIFAAVATLLTAVGLYALMSYVSFMRIREFGIRKALGANGLDVSKLVLTQGLRLLVIAVAFAAPAAVWLGVTMSPSLYHVGPFDLLALGSVVVLIGLVGLGAHVAPAYRASQVSPMDALRTD